MSMPPMLAYTIQGYIPAGGFPRITVGQGQTKKTLMPANPVDDSYWIAILDANNPTNKVQEFVVPGSQNSTVPAGLDAFMSKPGFLFALVTQNLSTLHVPQGAFYDYLASHGAGRELQRLEQINTSLGLRIDQPSELPAHRSMRTGEQRQPGLRGRLVVHRSDAADVPHADAQRAAALLDLRQLHVHHWCAGDERLSETPRGAPRHDGRRSERVDVPSRHDGSDDLQRRGAARRVSAATTLRSRRHRHRRRGAHRVVRLRGRPERGRARLQHRAGRGQLRVGRPAPQSLHPQRPRPAAAAGRLALRSERRRAALRRLPPVAAVVQGHGGHRQHGQRLRRLWRRRAGRESLAGRPDRLPDGPAGSARCGCSSWIARAPNGRSC